MEGEYDVYCRDCKLYDSWITPKNKCQSCGSEKISVRWVKTYEREEPAGEEC